MYHIESDCNIYIYIVNCNTAISQKNGGWFLPHLFPHVAIHVHVRWKKRLARAQLLIRQVQGPRLRAALIGAPDFGARAVRVAVNGAEELRVARTQPRHGGDGGDGSHGIFSEKKRWKTNGFPLQMLGEPTSIQRFTGEKPSNRSWWGINDIYQWEICFYWKINHGTPWKSMDVAAIQFCIFCLHQCWHWWNYPLGARAPGSSPGRLQAFWSQSR